MRFVVMLSIFFFAAGCAYENLGELEKPDAARTCIKVSYVAGICGQVALKIEDPRYAGLGETWNEHPNVFYTVLPCNAPPDLAQRSFFFVRILEKENLGNCARCEALFEYTGAKRYHIQVVEGC